MINILESASGPLTLKYNNLFIHSKYDPIKEAINYVNYNFKDYNHGIILIIGSALGYITDIIQKRYPESKLITIYLDSDIYSKSIYKAKLSWHPKHPLDINSFIKQNINESDISNLKLLEWPASIKCFKETANKCSKIIKQHIQEINGNIITTNYFGKTWIKNSFLNFLNIKNYVTINKFSQSVLICSSGPSLSKSLDLINKIQNKIEIWALPSSINALLNKNIIPDMVITTDPGYYAFSHLKELKNKSIPIFAPLSSTKGLWKLNSPVVPLSNSTFFEDQLLNNGKLSYLQLQSNGTVAGTALELACKLNKKEIIFTGQDFCLNDIQEHVRPHSFEDLLELDINRYHPFYSKIFRRSKSLYEYNKEHKVTTSRALLTYAGWFNHLNKNQTNIFRLNPSPIKTPYIMSLNNDEFKKILSTKTNKTKYSFTDQIINKETKIYTANNVLNNWRSDINQLEKNISNKGIDINNIQLELIYYIDTQNYIKMNKAKNDNNFKSFKSLCFESIKNIYSFFDKLDAIIHNT